MKKPIAIDLFCGAGGMSEGLIQAGYHIILSSDINESVQKTYVNRHEQLGLMEGVNTHFECCDIRDLNGELIFDRIRNLRDYRNEVLPKIDAIFGGPPCQGFSRAGLRKKNDPRNMLFKEYLRIISEVEPRYVVMENVEGFLTTKLDGFIGLTGKKYEDDKLVSEILKEEFVNINYEVLEPKVLDASNYGVPQRRKRVIYIAYKKNEKKPNYPEPITPLEEQKVTVLEAIQDLILNNNGKSESGNKKYIIASQKGRTQSLDFELKLHNHEVSNHNEIIVERMSLYKEGESARNVFKRLQLEGLNLENYPNLLSHCSVLLKERYTQKEIIEICKKGNLDKELVETILTKKNSRVKLDKFKPAPTILTSGDDYISPFENRGLTVREMARLQSFDDSFVFLGKRTTGGLRRRVEVPQYTQVGNAVPPLLSKAIAIELKKYL